jgi:hypothetical protein
MKYIIGFLFDILRSASALISAQSKKRIVLLGYTNLVMALFSLFITLFFGVVLGGAIGNDVLCSSLFILGAFATPLFGLASYIALWKR